MGRYTQRLANADLTWIKIHIFIRHKAAGNKEKEKEKSPAKAGDTMQFTRNDDRDMQSKVKHHYE